MHYQQVRHRRCIPRQDKLHNHTCFRRYISSSEWISGCYDGSVALWTQLKKKPVCIERHAHCNVHAAAAADAPPPPAGPGSVDADAAGWVQSVAVCPASDIAVRPPTPPVSWRIAEP